MIFLSVFKNVCMFFFPIENNDIEGLLAVEWTQFRFDYRRLSALFFSATPNIARNKGKRITQ